MGSGCPLQEAWVRLEPYQSVLWFSYWSLSETKQYPFHIDSSSTTGSAGPFSTSFRSDCGITQICSKVLSCSGPYPELAVSKIQVAKRHWASFLMVKGTRCFDLAFYVKKMSQHTPAIGPLITFPIWQPLFHFLFHPLEQKTLTKASTVFATCCSLGQINIVSVIQWTNVLCYAIKYQDGQGPRRLFHVSNQEG